MGGDGGGNRCLTDNDINLKRRWFNLNQRLFALKDYRNANSVLLSDLTFSPGHLFIHHIHAARK